MSLSFVSGISSWALPRTRNVFKLNACPRVRNIQKRSFVLCNSGDEWFARESVSFHCTQCGKCCSNPGTVWANQEEIRKIATHLSLSEENFVSEYAKYFGNGWFQLKKKEDTFECFFLNDGLCSINAVKPLQCSTYPYWPDVVTNPGSWMIEARDVCEGINHEEAPQIPADHVREQLQTATKYFESIKLPSPTRDRQ
mmetsp:Transcript_14612/g.24929  ORF Transcript_14612/g.24929 Transcript_14612/m.24929 type:complete len:197 (+) Transcript_14612:65-655(+)